MKAATADCSAGELAIFAEISFAARLSAIAPTIAGPSVNPKSRSMLVAPLAIPALSVGTLFTATTVIDVTASLKPIPTISSGTATAAMLRFVAGMAASHRSPTAIASIPPASVQPGLYFCSIRALTGNSTTPMTFRHTKPMDVFSGEYPWMAESRMLVPYAVPR